MDYEKKYREALEKLRSLHDDYDTVSTLIDIKEELEHIFPELCESEDEKVRKEIINFLKSPFVNNSICDWKIDPWVSWLEKQCNPTDEDMKEALRTEYEKGRADAFTQMQKEWSEEDEQIKERLIRLCTQFMIPDGVAITCEDWLKSIKDRVQPQNTWKPSDKQMEALLSEVNGWVKGCPKQIVLESLYHDLKKLKE